MFFPPAPSSKTNLVVLGATSTTITVEWDEIPCLQLNSQLEQYHLTFALLSDPQVVISFVAPDSSTNYTATGLARGTTYSITLAALFTVNRVDSPQLGVISTPINASTFPTPGTTRLQNSNMQRFYDIQYATVRYFLNVRWGAILLNGSDV